MKKNNHVALDALDLPYDLKKLDIDQCKQLCGEIRDILVETVSKNGGHLASNLGVVELTMAIHRAFNRFMTRLSADTVQRLFRLPMV